MKKRIISFVTFLIVLATFTSTLTGCVTSEDKIPIPKVEKNVYIYDEDNIIDDDVERNLNNQLVQLEEKTGAEFAIISIESLKNRDIESYANNIFNTLGIGKKGKDNGVLLLISRSDTKVRLEIGRGLEGCLPDAKCGRILDDFFVPYRETDEYTKATELTVNAVLKVLCEEYDITIDGLDTESIEIQEPEEVSVGEIILIIFIIVVVLIILEVATGYAFGDGFGDGIVFAAIESSSDGGFSGGGFGGGFSGGGGASR